MADVDIHYRGPRKITQSELNRLMAGGYKKFEECNEETFRSLFTDCPMPDKGVTKPFDSSYDPDQVYVFKYKELCYFLTPCEYYEYDIMNSVWTLTPTWQYFRSRKFKGCTKGYVSNLDKFIYPPGLIEKMI